MKRIISLFLLFFFTSTSLADLRVNPEDHMQNDPRGMCGWCSLETLGRSHHWDTAYGMVASQYEPKPHSELVAELNRRHIKNHFYQAEETEWKYLVWHRFKDEEPIMVRCCSSNKQAENTIADSKMDGDFWIQKKYYWKSEFLLSAARKDLGVAVSIDFPGHQRHMFVITGMDDHEVRVVDSNYPPGTIKHLPVDRFLEYWCGFAIVIDPAK